MIDEEEVIDEEKIRERAYQLWELDGRRERSGEAYWHQARVQLEAEIQPPEGNTLDSVSSTGQSGIAEMPVHQSVRTPKP